MDEGNNKKRRFKPIHLAGIVLLCVLVFFMWPRKASGLLETSKESAFFYGVWDSAEIPHTIEFHLNEVQAKTLMDYLDQYTISLSGPDFSNIMYMPVCHLYHRAADGGLFYLTIAVDGKVTTGHWWCYQIRPWDAEEMQALRDFLEDLTGQDLSGADQ